MTLREAVNWRKWLVVILAHHVGCWLPRVPPSPHYLNDLPALSLFRSTFRFEVEPDIFQTCSESFHRFSARWVEWNYFKSDPNRCSTYSRNTKIWTKNPCYVSIVLNKPYCLWHLQSDSRWRKSCKNCHSGHTGRRYSEFGIVSTFFGPLDQMDP